MKAAREPMHQQIVYSFIVSEIKYGYHTRPGMIPAFVCLKTNVHECVQSRVSFGDYLGIIGRKINPKQNKGSERLEKTNSLQTRIK